MEKVVYKVGEFTDFSGKRRQYIFAAVSVNSSDLVDFGSEKDPEKEVRLGLAIQKDGDVRNEELGKKIAYGKAMKDKSCIGKIYSTNKGMINYKLVNALLEQEAEYFENNPGRYIAGYDRALEKSRG